MAIDSTEKTAPDYTEPLPEVIPVYCWKINKQPDGTHYIVFYDRKKRMLRSATKNGCHFKENGYYLIRPTHSRLKTSSAGKPYIALHGLKIVSWLTKEDYQQYDMPPPPSRYAMGEVVKWMSVDEQDDCEEVEGVIIEMLYNKAACLWNYVVQSLGQEKTESHITEVDIV